jgi:hypothetical protein
MKHPKLMIAAALAASNAIAVAPALATSMNNLPAEQTHGQVTYRTGGIGETEAAAMRHAEANYPLSLEFVRRAKPTDEFLANVEVTIADHGGNTTLTTSSTGPFLLAKLPDGKYTVRATENGKTETRHVTVASGKPERIVFSW